MKLILLTLSLILAFVYVIDHKQVVVSASSVKPVKESSLKISEANVQLSARAYGVFDIDTGELLFSSNGHEKLPIASITKLFTAQAVLASSRLNESIVVTSADVATEGRSGKLEAGQVYTLRELLFPLLLESSNDSAVALSRVVPEIKIGSVPVADPAGLSSLNQASVAQLATLTTNLYHEQPHLFDITRLKNYVGSNTGWVNNSPVINMNGYVGGKHGFTNEAKQTLVALFNENHLPSRTIGYVILGSTDLRSDIAVLRAWVANSVSLQ
jgi:serine-type D-Ala-D-Ala carboxypeptidase (penicillin-binding protein 5/6)